MEGRLAHSANFKSFVLLRRTCLTLNLKQKINWLKFGSCKMVEGSILICGGKYFQDRDFYYLNSGLQN